MNDDIRIIREEWFENHKAKITKLSDRITVVDWRRENSSFYSVRYVFDGNMLYISGDIGEAVYWLTWHGTPESFKGVHFSYFNEKRQCSRRPPFEYYPEIFDKEVSDYLNSDWVEELTEEKKRKYEQLFQGVKSELESYPRNPEIQEFLMYAALGSCEYSTELEIDSEMAAHIAKFGRAPSISHLAYLEGLKMIAEQTEKESQA